MGFSNILGYSKKDRIARANDEESVSGTVDIRGCPSSASGDFEDPIRQNW